MLQSCLLLISVLCLTLVQPHHVCLDRIARDPECQNSDLRHIAKYFRETAIVRNENTNETHYCIRKQDSKDSNDINNLDQVIDLYKSLNYVNSYKYIDSHGPMIYDGFYSVNDYQILPVFQIADIRRNSFPCYNSHQALGNDVNDQMKLMGLNSTDIMVRLLAFSLGGPSRASNVIPMAMNMYEHMPVIGQGDSIGLPLSNWRSNEYWIHKFLFYYPNGRVLWKSAVQYEENMFSSPSQYHTYRPLSYSQKYVAYTNENDYTSIYYQSPDITFLNSNEYTCDIRISSCHDKKVKDPEHCNITNFTKTPQGKVGSRLNVQSNSTNLHNRTVIVPYYMPEGRTYVYQVNEWFWDVSEIRPNGEVILTDIGEYVEYRLEEFTYFMNGIQYLYTFARYWSKWSIHELLPDGKISKQVTDEGKWTGRYHGKSVSFTIDGKYYFFAQWNLSTTYFIKKLEPYGRMKREDESTVETNTWPEYYPTLVSYTINTRVFLFAHCIRSKAWTIHEILPGGKVRKKLDYGTWSRGYDVAFWYTLNDKHFLYAMSKNPYYRMIKELLPNGKMGKQNTDESSNDKHSTAAPIILNGKLYVYRKEEDQIKYSIHQLV